MNIWVKRLYTAKKIRKRIDLPLIHDIFDVFLEVTEGLPTKPKRCMCDRFIPLNMTQLFFVIADTTFRK